MHYGPDWLASKICPNKDLASYDFGYYLVCNQNLSTSHIWLAKSMAIFYLTLASQVFGMANFGRKPIRPYNSYLSFSKKNNHVYHRHIFYGIKEV
jgi:hypothetical protein